MRKILFGLNRNEGVSLITLIIAITIFATFITVFSYVMVSKHKSEILYAQSTQAYAIAQAGIEYGIRYATVSGYGDFTINKTYENGSFTLVYTPATVSTPSKLTSTGTVGNAERQIILNNFVGFVSGSGISLDPSENPYS